MSNKGLAANQSIQRAFQIIEVLSNNRESMRLQDIADAVSLPASTVLRMLNSLQQHDYVFQNPDSARYSLSLKFARIGALVCSKYKIRDIMHPHLLVLSYKCKASVGLALEEPPYAVYVDVSWGTTDLPQVMIRLGQRIPMHCTAAGKIMLADYSDDELQQYLRSANLKQYSPSTICSSDDLAYEINKIKRNGYAQDNQEFILGVNAIGKLVLDHTDEGRAAVSVNFPSIRLSDDYQKQILDALDECISSI